MSSSSVAFDNCQDDMDIVNKFLSHFSEIYRSNNINHNGISDDLRGKTAAAAAWHCYDD